MQNNRGFTLVELMIVLAITSGVIAGTYWSIATQQRTYNMQEEVARMQQNLRTAMYIMGSEIRMAGYDPTNNADAAILDAQTNSITFTLDDNMDETLDSDGDGAFDNGEGITYSLYDYPASSPDGDMDIGRDPDGDSSVSSGGLQGGSGNRLPLAENIDALDFVYLDESGNVTATLADIRAVQITIIGRVDREDPKFIDNTVYNNPQGVQILAAQNDRFHRHMLTKTINCRNMGL